MDNILLPQDFSSVINGQVVFSYSDVMSEIGYYIERSDDGSTFYCQILEIYINAEQRSLNRVQRCIIHNKINVWFRLKAVN